MLLLRRSEVARHRRPMTSCRSIELTLASARQRASSARKDFRRRVPRALVDLDRGLDGTRREVERVVRPIRPNKVHDEVARGRWQHLLEDESLSLGLLGAGAADFANDSAV